MALRRTSTYLAGLSLALVACLPEDSRSPPGSLLVTVKSTPSLDPGVPFATSEDGWSISYERFLIALGRAGLGSPYRGEQYVRTCKEYSESSYDRIFSMFTPGSQKVSLHYALGECEFDFMVSNPSSNTVLGTGVTEQDKAFMLESVGGMQMYRGLSLYVQGKATKGVTTKRFAWALHESAFCGNFIFGPLASSSPAKTILLRENEPQVTEIGVYPGTLFQDHFDPNLAKLRFDALADADDKYGNGDGEITLDELDKVTLANARSSGGAYMSISGSSGFATLEFHISQGMFRAMVRSEDGLCSTR